MATAVDISAPVCETREEQGGDLVDQATVVLINKLSNEEQSQAHTHNGLSMVEGGNFLTPPSIGEIHCEVNSSSPDQIVKDETDIVPLGKAKSDDQPTAIAVNESGRIQQNVEESDGLVEEETKESKTTYDKVGDVKPTEEDILEIPKSGNILENPAESLHVAPENIEASILSQEKNIKSFPEDQSSNITLSENAGGETEQESNDAVNTRKEILEGLSTIASSSPEEGSINAVPLEVASDSTNENTIDGTGTQKEVLENNFSNVSNEDVKGHLTEHGEPRNVEHCENESTQSTVLEIESKIEKSEDPLRATSEDINTPEIETSCIEEQSVTTHPQGILDEKTEDEAIAADKMEGIIETVPTVVSIEKAEDNSCPKMENEDHLEKDAEQPSPVEDFTGNIVTDEVKVDDKNSSRAELLEEEYTESGLLKEEVQKEKPLESLHAVLEDIKPSDLDQHTETRSFLEEKSLTENPQEILGEETEEKTINAVSNENGKDSLIQVDAREMEQDLYLEKETEPSLTKASVDDATHDESINLAEPEIGDVRCEVNNSSPDVSMVTEKPDQIEKDEADIMPLGKPKSDDQPTAIAVNEETSSGRIQQTVEESDGLNEEETKESKTNTSTDEIVGDGRQTEEDILEIPKSGNILENPAESLHVAPENIEASTLGQGRNIKSFPEDQSTNRTLHENVGGETEEKSIDAVDTRKEILESLPTTIASSSPEEGSTNAVLLEVSSDCTNEKIIDGTGTQKEVIENDFSYVSNEDVKGNSTEHGEPRNVEFCENESTESAVLKIESKIETSADPEHATSEDINAPEIETRSCTEEKSVATHPQGILDEKTEGEAVDAAEMEEITETVPTVVSIEKTEDNSCPKMENEDHLEKDAEQPSPLEDFTGIIVPDEVKIDDKIPSRAELLEEENTESALLKEEVQKEKPLESLDAVLEDIKPSDLDQHTETRSFLEEKSLTENPQEILGEETEEKTIDAVSNEDNGKDSLIQVDAREMEQGADLEKEVESSLTKASVEDANVDLQSASEDHKASASSEDIETTRSHKEESLVMSDNTIDATNTEEAAHEIHNVTTEVQVEHTEESSVTLVDCSQIEQEEHLERDGENSSWTEAPIEETKAGESKGIQAIENKGINSMKAELENEKDVESTLAKEGEVENPIDSLQTVNQDIKASDSNNCFVEQLPTTNPEELSSDQTEKEYVNAAEVKEGSLEDIVKNVPDGDNADDSPTEEDGSQEPSLKDAMMGNNNAEEPTVAHEAKPVDENEKFTECTSVKEELSTESSALGQDEETSSLEEKSPTTNSQGIMDDTEDKSNGAIVADEETPKDKENIGETTPYEDIEENVLVQEDYPQLEHKKDLENDSENTSSREVLIRETTEGNLDKEEAQVEKPIESLQIPTEDIKASESCQETYSIDEKILSAGPEEIPSDKTEETTTNSAYTENENLELQNVENVPSEGSDYSQTEGEGPQKSFLEETSIGNNNDAESTITHYADENIVKTDLLGNEESIECALVKEEVPLKSLQKEAQEEKPIDSSQEARVEIKASDSSQDTNCDIAEKSLTAYPQEIASDKTEKDSIDAINRREESIEVKYIPDGDDAVHSPVEENVSQKPCLKEATTRNDNDDESTITNEAKLVGENERDNECALVKEEVSIELQQVAAQDTEVSSLGQDRETSSLEVQSLTTNLQGFMDEKEDKTSDATGAAEETPEDKDVVTAQYEDIEENLLVEEDCKQAEQNEDSVNDSENTSLTEALIGNTGEGTLVKEEAHDKKHFESLQVATEDAEASDSCHETSFNEEKILTGDSQENSCDRIEEKTVDAAYNKKENLEEVATKIPNASDEDNSPIQVDGLQKPPVEEASTIVHEAKSADESKVTADLFQNETKMECGLVKEEVSVKSLQVENEDIKPTASSQDREISHLKEEALEDKSNATSSHEDTIGNSSIQVDCIQLEQNENLEKASESTSLAEAPTADIIENILVKEKAEEENHHIETLQVATEDMKASASCQEKSSIEEKILTGDSQEISCDKAEEKTTNSAYAGKESFEDAAINVPIGNSESSPIEVDGSQKPSLKEASTENTNDHESTISHDIKAADDLYENEKNIECDFAKEEASIKSLDVETGDSKVTASNQDRESGHIEEQGLIREPQGIKGAYKEDKIIDVTDLKEVTHEDNSNVTISYENTTENSSVQVDCSQLEQNEHSEKDNEITSITEALATDTTESALAKEEAQNKDHTDSLQVATEDIKSFSPCQDTETSSIEEQVLIADPEDITRNKIIEKTVDASDNEKTTAVQVENEDIKVTASSQDKETSHLEEQSLNTNPQGIMGDHKENKTVDEDKSYATTSSEDSKESSFVQVDCSQLEQNEHSEKDGESTSLTEAPAADTIESALVMEEVQDEDHIESLQAATEDVKAFAPSQDTKTSFTEEQVQTVDPEDISRDKTVEHTIDASDKENTPEVQEKNTEATLKEDAYIASSQEATEDIKASSSSEGRDSRSQEEQTLGANPEGLKDENRETETFPKDEVPKEIESVHFEARSIELKEEEGCLKDMSTAVNIAVHEEKDSDPIAVKLPCTKDLDAVDEVAVAEDSDSKQEESSITEVPEVHTIISHENVPDVTSLASDVVEEANSCGDKTDTEKIAVLDDGSSMISTNETLPETDPRGGPEAEAQVPDGEKEAELVQQDPTTEIDQKDIEGQLLFKDSQVILEPKGVNDEDEKTNSDNCKEISGSSNSGVLEEESTSDFQESRKEMREEVENEEAQKQEKELHVSVPVHDSSLGKVENHVQELEQAPLPASDENIIEKTECNESEIVEDAIKNREGDDRTETFFNDKKVTEREQEETESGQEKITSDEKVQTTTSTSDIEAIDFHPILSSETSKVDHSVSEGEVATDREGQNVGKIASDGNEDTRIDNNRSITDLECKNDDEAPEIIQTTPSASEGQDVESTDVGETTALISECQRDGYEHANTSSATEERPDSKEVVFEAGEQRSEYESKTQVLESVSQVQSCKIVAETEETKTEEKNIETAGETELEKVVAEDISGQEETKHETEILKTKEGDKDVEDYHQASHQEEVIIGSHLEEETNQEEEISTGFEDIKKENETEKVPKIFQEADDKALEEPEENLLGKESIDRGLDQEEQLKSVQEVTTAIDTEETQELDIGCVKTGAQNSNEEINRPTVAFPDEEENRTGADDTEKEIAGDEGMLNQNSKIPEIDAAAREMPKELDENITCEAPINTFHKTIEDSEVNKEQQEEHSTRKDEILPLPELVQGKDSEKQNQKDEICGSDEVQPRDEQIVTHSEEKSEEESKGDGEATETCVEPEHDFSFHIKDISEVPTSDDAQVIPDDDESKKTSPGEDCSNKSTQPQISTVSDDTELTEQASEATRITAEMQEPKVGINSQDAIPNATEVESRQVEEAGYKCKVVAETSTPVEPPMITTSKIILEVGDQQTKLHDLPQELNIMDTEVMAEKDDPENLQNVRDVSQDVQESKEGSFEVSNKENPVEASPDENMKTSEEKETEEQQLGRAPGNATEAGVNCEEEKIINDKSNQLENSWSAETEKVSESNTYPSSMDDTAQHDKVEGSPRQIDSLSILPEAKCSEIDTTGNDIPAHFEGVKGTGVTQIEVTPLPSKVENANSNEKLSAERSLGEHDLLEPSKVEQQAADCGNEVKTDQETAEKPESKETNEPSLSDLFDVSMRKTSKMDEHTTVDEEPATHTRDLRAEKPDEDQHENAKTEEENNDEDELSEQKRSELSSESLVMVEMADADVKVSHKKSHNILSGVGSKVKHSIAKVKKAITGKSSHPKPPSPKKTQVEK